MTEPERNHELLEYRLSQIRKEIADLNETADLLIQNEMRALGRCSCVMAGSGIDKDRPDPLCKIHGKKSSAE